MKPKCKTCGDTQTVVCSDCKGAGGSCKACCNGAIVCPDCEVGVTVASTVGYVVEGQAGIGLMELAFGQTDERDAFERRVSRLGLLCSCGDVATVFATRPQAKAAITRSNKYWLSVGGSATGGRVVRLVRAPVRLVGVPHA